MDFVFDLDGSICFKGQPVTEKILAALKNLESGDCRSILNKEN